MKTIRILLAILCLSFISFAQTDTKNAPKFDIADFNKKFEVVQWLVQYDTVAWKTTDEVMKQDPKELARLGAEWFCFEDKNKLWHAVYGKFENDRYDLVFHFTMDTNSNITLTKDKVDQIFLDLHAKALRTADTQLKTALKGKEIPAFNQYIRQNADKTFNVWLLPAFQTNGIAVYGGEAVYTIDPTGAKITRDESYFQSKFRGFQTTPSRDIWLDYRELEKPSLGSIFFVWYYKAYFTEIYIDNAKTTSTVVNTATLKNAWIHVVKKNEEKPSK